MPQLPAEILQSWDQSSRREWLVTNGIGGYAASSVSGANTRRYHGLLVPAFHPPLGRAVLLSKLEEEVRVEDQVYLLSANKYPSVVAPQGFRHLTYFNTRPVPTFTYIFHEETVVLEKRIWMAHGRNTVYIQYHLVKAPETVRLGLVPLMAYKDYHSEQHRWDGFTGDTQRGAGRAHSSSSPTSRPTRLPGLAAPVHLLRPLRLVLQLRTPPRTGARPGLLRGPVLPRTLGRHAGRRPDRDADGHRGGRPARRARRRLPRRTGPPGAAAWSRPKSPRAATPPARR